MKREALWAALGGPDGMLQLAPDLDLRRLGLSPMEGFVLSRIGDGMRVREICQVSGLAEEQTLSILTQLRQQGVLVSRTTGPQKTGQRQEGRRTPSGHTVREPLWKAEERKQQDKQRQAPPPQPQAAPAKEGSAEVRVMERTGVFRVLQVRPAQEGPPLTQPLQISESTVGGGAAPAPATFPAESGGPAPAAAAAVSAPAATRAAPGPAGSKGEPARSSAAPTPGKTHASGTTGKDASSQALVYQNARPSPEELEKLAAQTLPASDPELQEQVELDEDLQRLILYLYRRRSELDYYQILAVPPDVERAALRKAFLRRTRLFHPDRYYSKRIGSYSARVQELYKRISIAYDALSDERTRKLYDQTLALSRQFADLPGGVNLGAQAARLYEEGKRLGEAGDHDAAQKALQQAVEMEPRNDRYRSLLHHVQETSKRARTSQAFQRGLAELEQGRHAAAIELLRQVVATQPTPEALHTLATALLRAGQDLPEAAQLARKALQLAPEMVDAAIAVSRIEEQQGNLAEARSVLMAFQDQARSHRSLAERWSQLFGKS